jgi:hypothetical protein
MTMAEEQAQSATKSFFTKDQVANARRAGISDQEIGLALSEGNDQIKNALEAGVTLDELAEYFSV